jgi:uncharacterized repeat protein (TIGR03843 family)
VSRVVDLLAHGNTEIHGLVPWSSNYTFLVTVRDEDLKALAIYKPCRGERPLWDFSAGSLCRREVAAYLLSRSLGWPEIPPVVLRDGVHGPGSVQLFVEADPEAHYFTMRGRSEYDDALRLVALFDCVVNNADRKGGHLLKGAEGQVWAIDHGLTFHSEYKLRTVIWEYAGQPIAGRELDDLGGLRDDLETDDAPLCRALLHLIDGTEIEALRRRLDHLLRARTFPLPLRSRRSVPYPLI